MTVSFVGITNVTPLLGIFSSEITPGIPPLQAESFMQGKNDIQIMMKD